MNTFKGSFQKATRKVSLCVAGRVTMLTCTEVEKIKQKKVRYCEVFFKLDLMVDLMPIILYR